MKEFNLVKTIKIYGSIFIIAIGVLICLFNVYKDYTSYKKISSDISKNIIAYKKELIKNIVLQTVSMIKKTKNRAVFEAYNDAKNRVYNAYNIINNIYNKFYKKLPEKTLEKIVIESIRCFKYKNSKNYFFIVKTNGNVLLNAAYPQIEGENLYNLQDKSGKYFIREMVNIAINKGEGYCEYYWYRPDENRNKKLYKKISFVKFFKPFNFLIGSGVYIKDFYKITQKDLLYKISSMRYGRQGYVFINKFDGTALITNGRLIKANKKLWELFNNKERRKEVKKIFQNEFNTIKTMNGGFLICNWEKLKNPNKISKMLVYLYPIKEWNWIVGSGVFLDDIEKLLKNEKNEMLKYLIHNIIFSIVVIISFIMLLIIIINKFGNFIESEFKNFIEYFEQSLKENILISENKIKLVRLKKFARLINNILKEKSIVSVKFEEERNKFKITLESLVECVITLDFNKKIDFMNKSAETLTGYQLKEIKGQNIFKIFKIVNNNDKIHVDILIEKVFKTKKIFNLPFNLSLISKDNKIFPIAGNISPIIDSNKNVIGIILVFRDITLEIKRDKELIKNEKLNSISVLAGGIAHDFNNLLTSLYGYLSLAKGNISPASKSYTFLSKAEKTIEQTKMLTYQLLTFSKGGEPVFENVDLKILIKETVKFNLRGSSIKAYFDFEKNLNNIIADKGQIGQVIANLTLNAIQASKPGGKIFIKVENIENPLNDLEGSYIKIIFQDNGKGIPEKIIDKIFDPYFTTKDTGSGLGLAMVYSIIKKHNGKIIVKSELNKGTTFVIYLPAEKSLTKTVKIKNNNGNLDLSKKSKYKILVLDDDINIRDTFEEMLKSMGHFVTTISNSKQFFYEYNKQKFDIVILDLTMPGEKGGKEIINDLIKIDPEIKAIIMSGYSESEIIKNYKKYGFKGYLTKPFTLKQLSKAIDETMN